MAQTGAVSSMMMMMMMMMVYTSETGKLGKVTGWRPGFY
jgi:hypothetical protein